MKRALVVLLVVLGCGGKSGSGRTEPDPDMGGAGAGGRDSGPAPVPRGGAGGGGVGGGGAGGSAGGAGAGGRGGAGGSVDAAMPMADAAPADARDAGSGASDVRSDGSGPDVAGAVQRLLYVVSAGSPNAPGTIDLFDIDQNHRLVRRIRGPIYGATDKGPSGMTAHAATGRLFVTEYVTGTLTAFDLMTERVLWTKRSGSECMQPDRLTITKDGKTLVIPCHMNDRVWIVNAATGDTIKTIPYAGRPHNSFTGEAGKYVYVAASRNREMMLLDPTTLNVSKMLGPVSGIGIRPFSVNKTETQVFCNLVALLGFIVGDTATGQQIHEIKVTTPAERTMNRAAEAPRHGADPVYYTLSHGIAVRPPDSKEVWFIDDLWGYLYAFDVTVAPPRQLAAVPLFEKIDQPFSTTNARWVTFSMDGRYAYPASGLVVDAEARKLLPVKITQSEKMVEVQWRGGVPIAVSGQMGGIYLR